jgi:NADH-quinone oxidoreductase subunit L
VLNAPSWGLALRQRLSVLYELLVNKYYFDWFNENVLARLARWLGIALWRGGDQGLIDGAVVNGSAGLVGWIAGVTRHLQSGFLYSYAFWMIIGLALLLGWFLTHN